MVVRREESNERGNVLLIVAFMMVVLAGIAALALDTGVLYVDKAKMQAAVDASALAGASMLLQGANAAETAAANMAVSNDGQMNYQGVANLQSDSFTATGTYSTPLWFANVLGIHTATVHASATAAMQMLNSVVGAVPLGVPIQAFTYGQEVTLSASAGNGQSGNFAFLNFSGSGSKGLETDLAMGYALPLTVGELVSTETGVMSGPVLNAITYRMNQAVDSPGCSSMSTAQSDCSRVMIVPVLNTLDVNGAKDVTILGFAVFYLDGLVNDGGHQDIMGRYMQMIVPGQMGADTNYGSYAVSLIH